LQLWDPDTGAKLATLAGQTEWWSNAIAWSRDGRYLATGGPDKTVRTWEAAGKLLHTFRGHTGPIHAVAWSADGQTLASAGADHTVRLWDTANGQTRHVLQEHKAGVVSLAWSPDGKTLVSFGDRTTIFWDPATGRVRHKVDSAYGPLAWSPDGKTLATVYIGVRLLNGETGEFVRDLEGFPEPLNALAFSPDGKTLVACGVGAVQVLDVASGRPHGVLLGLPEEGQVAIQANGHWRGSPGVEKQLLYIAVTDAGQETLTYEEFSKKYG
jgi:WD40 repeat protein